MFSAIRRRTDRLAALSFLLIAGAVAAQPLPGYLSDFESLTATPAGTQLWDPFQPAGTPGQDGYYYPSGTTSVPFYAHTYAGNTLGVPPHPAGGGAVFIAGEGPASPTFARAQRDISYGLDMGPWTIATDILIQFRGTLPATQNIGSLSTQPFPGGQSFIMLARWTDTNTATTWNADYVYFDAAGTQITASVPNTAFQGLAVNTWYRWETDVNLTTNQILQVRITDLATGTTAIDSPTGWYMLGGTIPGGPLTGFRFFAGGGQIGNLIAWDNPALRPGIVSGLPGPDPCGNPCCYPANSFGVAGFPQLGGTMTFFVDDPTGSVTSGGSFAAVAVGIGPSPNPCVPIPGFTNGALINLPLIATLFSATPWTGPGMPVSFSFPMPPNMAANAVYLGLPIDAQGLLLDVTTGQVLLLRGAEMRLGG